MSAAVSAAVPAPVSAVVSAAEPPTIASEPTWQLLQGVILSNHCEPVLLARGTADPLVSPSAR